MLFARSTIALIFFFAASALRFLRKDFSSEHALAVLFARASLRIFFTCLDRLGALAFTAAFNAASSSARVV
jgi:hypothetical protein